LLYLRELFARRDVILKSIEEQGKLTPELKADILAADTKTRLEDLYLPYKPKRRTKGEIAKEAGLEPLALGLYEDPTLAPEAEAQKYLNAEKAINTIKDALEGAKFILMEKFAEDANLIGMLRDYLWQNAQIKSAVIAGQEEKGEKFSDYFDKSEAIKVTPSHRALAMLRGRQEGVLDLKLVLPDTDMQSPQAWQACENMIAKQFGISDKGRAADAWLQQVVRWTWQIKLLLSLETELVGQLRESAEMEAIKVFGANLRDLLLASPAGARVTMGLDPGLRTGVKVAVVDATGKLLDTGVIYPHVPKNEWKQSMATLALLCQKHGVELISIGNGTASRETDKLAAELMQHFPQLKLTKITVSEAGASVYSASELAALEFPNLDVTLRGAVSIARRLQDPLAELVKIEPKAIGVGQYQHDVSQKALSRALEGIIEDCVNAVGVEVNTASVALLSRVAGLNKTLATNIVMYRDQHGRFTNRKMLKKVERLGEKAFEQAAGFLRIREGENPLDASAVHPEAYIVVESILEKQKKSLKEVLGNAQILTQLNPKDYINEQFGVPTIIDIIKELDKPGRDPRPDFKTATFQEGVYEVSDLQVGMVLEGVVTNVANFGAFVDIGVHQDGLVHISQLSTQFVSDPRTVVKTGDIVQVKVLEVEPKRKRISLTMRLNEKVMPVKRDENTTPASVSPKIIQKHSAASQQQPNESALSLAFKAALLDKK